MERQFDFFPELKNKKVKIICSFDSRRLESAKILEIKHNFFKVEAEYCISSFIVYININDITSIEILD